MFTLATFYKSKQWEDLLQQLKLERLVDGQLICEHCGKPIVKAYDCIGHHKIELTDANVNNLEISLNKENIMLIHFKCHNQIHERFGFEKPRKVYIVYGSPCSGKSTWVNENATKDDFIIDIDKVWECVSVCDKFHKPNRLTQNVFGIRDCLLDQVRMRIGNWKTAFIVGTYPYKMERERLANRLGAELIYIDTDKEICLARSKNNDWNNFVEDWFEKFQP